MPLLRDQNPPPRFVHMVDEFGVGTDDEVWAPLVQQHGWLPITKDSGRKNVGPKLPLICAELGLQHVVLSGRLGQARGSEQALAVAGVWPAIVRIWRDRIGVRHVIRRTSSGRGFVLVQTELPKRL